MSKQNVNNVYWDANAWIGYLGQEERKIKACTEVIDAAKRGEYVIWCSSIVHIEVFHLGKKHEGRAPSEDIELIRRFFREPFLRIVAADTQICQLAQELYWKYPFLEMKDSIHVATAIRHKIQYVHSYDPHFVAISGKVGTPPLIVSEPQVIQGNLFGGIQ